MIKLYLLLIIPVSILLGWSESRAIKDHIASNVACLNVHDYPWPSLNDGPLKQSIISFVKATTDSTGKGFIPKLLGLTMTARCGQNAPMSRKRGRLLD